MFKQLSGVMSQLKTCALPLYQVAVKNNIDVFYFSCTVPMHVFFTEDGEMDKKEFLASWKEIPVSNEVQYTIRDVQHNAGEQCSAILKY